MIIGHEVRHCFISTPDSLSVLTPMVFPIEMMRQMHNDFHRRKFHDLGEHSNLYAYAGWVFSKKIAKDFFNLRSGGMTDDMGTVYIEYHSDEEGGSDDG